MASSETVKTPVASAVDDIPLADDADDSAILTGGRTPRPAAPLPRDEPPEDPEEKARLIAQVLELQNTLDGGLLHVFIPSTDLSQRVDSVKEESAKLRSENQVLGQYIQNLMASSAVFQSAQPAVNTNKQEMFGNFFW